MDLGAFAQIDTLDKIAEINGIDVPRLRGYRLMSECKPYTDEEIQEQIQSIKQCYRKSHHSLSRLYSIKAEVRRQCETWNKYAGRSDVLYIHSRMGGTTCGYWDDEKGEHVTTYDLKAQPWFLDHVYDAYDGTYCDIYAKITVFPDGE